MLVSRLSASTAGRHVISQPRPKCQCLGPTPFRFHTDNAPPPSSFRRENVVGRSSPGLAMHSLRLSPSSWYIPSFFMDLPDPLAISKSIVFGVLELSTMIFSFKYGRPAKVVVAFSPW